MAVVCHVLYAEVAPWRDSADALHTCAERSFLEKALDETMSCSSVPITFAVSFMLTASVARAGAVSSAG